MTRLLTAILLLLITACVSTPMPWKEECPVAIYQDGKPVLGASHLDGVTVYTLKKRAYVIKVPSPTCNASIGVFSTFEKMRYLGAARSRVFTTSGFEMSGTPGSPVLPLAQDAERIPATDLDGFLGKEGMRNFQTVCKSDGKCPIPLAAFRSYHNFLESNGGGNQPKKEATINYNNQSNNVALMVYTESKRFLHLGANGNWPADVVLEPHALLLVFTN